MLFLFLFLLGLFFPAVRRTEASVAEMREAVRLAFDSRDSVVMVRKLYACTQG